LSIPEKKKIRTFLYIIKILYEAVQMKKQEKFSPYPFFQQKKSEADIPGK